MPNQVNKPANKLNPIVSMIMPGRRSLGEGWRKVSIHPDPDTGNYLIDNEPTEAPAHNRTIMVPGLGNVTAEMADFMLEHMRDKAKTPKARSLSKEEEAKQLNEAWQDYMEQKLRAFKGQTTVGTKLYQRESLND